MNMHNFFEHLDSENQKILKSLDHPLKIQAYLDSLSYSAEDLNRTPVQVMLDRKAHCLDGAIFAAAALTQLGYPARLIDMFPDPGKDDDHVLAIFKQNGGFGAIAKSNFTGLRYREPIHRSIRELVLTYFDDFFNVYGEKTLRTYTRILNLAQFDHLGWIRNPAGIDAIEQRLLSLPRYPLLTPEMASHVSAVDPISYKAGMLIANPDGLYQPEQKPAYPA